MKTFKFLLFIPLVFLVLACNQTECCDLEGDPISDLPGSWLLFERGFSPGGGYIVEPVEASPAQTMNFQSNGDFSSNIQGLEDFKFFLILKPEDRLILALYKSKSAAKDQGVDNLQHSYIVEFESNNSVKLYFRYCIEGCHLGLSKIN